MRPDLAVPNALGRSILAAVVLATVLAVPARALDVSGSLRAWIGLIDAGGLETEEQEQAFRLGLSQELSPWLTLFGAFRALSFRSNFDAQSTFERTSEQPEIGLSYDRDRFDARLLFTDRAIRTTDESQNLDIRTFLAGAEWRPLRGPRLGFRLQDSTSTADAVLFGRDTRSRNVAIRADYSRTSWSARYSFDVAEVRNRTTGLNLEQSRHEVRAGYFDSLWEDRWSFSLDARYANVEQTQDAPTGTVVSLPVPATQGFFAIDPTPALGALEPAPELIDGDTAQPAAPGIEIGGANTFRNVGVDLGITRPISGLEITVNSPSGLVVWQVWESSDNTSWFQIGSATSVFDAGFLRYTIQFPETTARYVKAVNVSVNPAPEAAVTEVRALLATAQLERTEGTGSEYWVNLQSNLRATDRIELSVAANVRRDQDLVATQLRRSYDQRGLSAQLRTDLHRRLQLRIGYRMSELDESVRSTLERREESATAVLDWRPLDTVGVLLTAQQREEKELQQLLNSTDSLVLQATTEVFPDLVLNSTFGFADTVDLLFGFTQETRYVIETVEARPSDRWLLAGTFSRYDYDSVGRVVVTSRTGALVSASWFATPFLSLSGEGQRAEDDFGDTMTQRWGVQWSPGPKLSISSGYFETDSSAGSGTANLTFDGSYRLNRRVRIWASLNEAESFVDTLEPLKTEALRVGVNAVF